MVRHHSGGHAFAGAVIGAVSLVAAAGCASGGSHTAATAPGSVNGSASPSPPSGFASSAASSTTTSSTAVDQNSPQAVAAIATYRALWSDVVTVQETMNDQDPRLADHMTGQAISYFVKAIHVNRLNGYVAKGAPKLLSPTVGEVVGSGSSTQVVVNDCVDDSSDQLYTTDGTKVQGGNSTGRHKTQVLVIQSGGVWKASQFAYSRVGTC